MKQLYIILNETHLDNLEKAVNKKNMDGYVPQGGPFRTSSVYNWGQAMVLKEVLEK